MTSANINKCIAIVADDKLLSCPNVINVIDGGTTQISGNFSKLEAKLIVDGINAGR
jgi:SecD/SecF fusion protein